MATASLASFPRELLWSWELFRSRWRTALQVALIPLIPLAASSAFFVGYPRLGVDRASTTLAGIGALALGIFYLTTIPSRTALFILFTRRESLTFREAVRAGLRRFWPFLTTELFIILLIGLSLLPLLAFQGWFTSMARPTLLTTAGATAANVAALLGVLLFALPAVLLAVAVSFAPITAAVEETAHGLSALRRSWALLRGGTFRKVLQRLGLWIVLFVVVCTAVEPLPFAQWITPFVMTLIGAAFLTVLYKELKAGA